MIVSNEKTKKWKEKNLVNFDPQVHPSPSSALAQGQQIKNRLGGPKSITLGTYHAKFGVFIRLGYRGMD